MLVRAKNSTNSSGYHGINKWINQSVILYLSLDKGKVKF